MWLVLSNDPSLSAFEVEITDPSVSVDGVKNAIRARCSLQSSVGLTLVRMRKGDVDGLKAKELLELNDLLILDTYGTSPENQDDNSAAYGATEGLCISKDSFTFKVMNPMDPVSLFIASLPERRVHVLVLVASQRDQPVDSKRLRTSSISDISEISSLENVNIRGLRPIDTRQPFLQPKAKEIKYVGVLSLDPHIDESLAKFMALAVFMEQDPAILAITNCIQKLEPSDEIPFVFVEGSSGTGKTQTALTVTRLLSQTAPAFYFLYKPPTKPVQAIYQNFRSITTFFRNCVKLDGAFYENNLSPSCNFLSAQDLHVFGFIYNVLLSCGTSNLFATSTISATVETLSGVALGKFLEQYISKFGRPTFIIDECNIGSTDEEHQMFRFVRNTFRCMGLALVLLGTDSRLVEVTDTIGNSSRAGGFADSWCFVFNQLPHLWVPSIILPANMPSGIKNIILHSRPWFAETAAKYWNSTMNPNLDGMISAVYAKIVEDKKIFDYDFGKLGQIRLFLDSSYVGSEHSGLIHRHFAQENGLPNFLLSSSIKVVSGSSEDWIPVTVFPPVETDPLLYLSLTGSLNNPAFVSQNKSVPYHWFWNQATNLPSNRQYNLQYENAAQAGNDGNQLETLLVTCVCVASHFHGVQGILLMPFLKELVFHLQSKLTYTATEVHDYQSLLAPIKLVRIPFLSCPGRKWPDFVFNSGLFGTLRRTMNKEKIDLFAYDGVLSGECKYYLSDIPHNVMVGILNRTPLESKLHIVLVRSMQSEYFTKHAYSNCVIGKVAKSFVVCMLDTGANPLKVEQVKGIPKPRIATGVILFIECARN